MHFLIVTWQERGNDSGELGLGLCIRESSKTERKVQYELFIEHFSLGYTENGRQTAARWLEGSVVTLP